MAHSIVLDDVVEQTIADLIRRGRYATADEAVRAGIARLAVDDVAEPPISAEEWAGIERGLADVAAGRVVDADILFAELRARPNV